ncbi:hypothetical protein, partial [Mesorhizobium sp.]|uniref:hypothetical protein n=1 Tax=Mesorhizobium sp. TaxID=1871066 RepID=UPI00344E3432
YTITVTGTITGQVRSDPDALIGYDPPLRTYFLQAFPHEETDEPALWLGTHGRAFETLEDLHHAATALGYDFMPLPYGLATKLVEDKPLLSIARARLRLLEAPESRLEECSRRRREFPSPSLFCASWRSRPPVKS